MQRRTVVVVEDEPLIRLNATSMFEDAGHRCRRVLERRRRDQLRPRPQAGCRGHLHRRVSAWRYRRARTGRHRVRGLPRHSRDGHLRTDRRAARRTAPAGALCVQTLDAARRARRHAGCAEGGLSEGPCPSRFARTSAAACGGLRSIAAGPAMWSKTGQGFTGERDGCRRIARHAGAAQGKVQGRAASRADHAQGPG